MQTSALNQSVQQVGWQEINRASTLRRRFILWAALAIGLLAVVAVAGVAGYRYWRDQAPSFEPESEAAVTSPAIAWWQQIKMPTTPETPGTDIFHVSPRGSDNGTGRENSPWRTVQYAVSRLRPGQTLYLRSGIYREYVEVRVSGAPNAPVTIAGYPGEKAVMDGAGVDWHYGISLSGNISHIIIQNLTVRNYAKPSVGISGWDDTDYITIRDVNISGVTGPLKFAASGNKKIVRSFLHFENINATDYNGSGMDLGPGAVSDVTVKNVNLLGTASDDSNTAVDGLAVEEGQRIYIEKVKVIGHPGDGIDLKADNITVRQAEVRDFGRNGVKLWGANGSVENCVVTSTVSPLTIFGATGPGPYFIRNNFIAGGKGHSFVVTLGPGEPRTSGAKAQLTLQGNIFYNPENSGTTIVFSQWCELQPDSGYNLYYAPKRPEAVLAIEDGKTGIQYNAEQINKGQWAAAMGADGRSRYLDPLINDAGLGKFELLANSPAIDALPAKLAPAIDFLGRKRPAGVRSDIGPAEKERE